MTSSHTYRPRLSLIPQPWRVLRRRGQFKLDATTRLAVSASLLGETAEWFRRALAASTGVMLSAGAGSAENSIQLALATTADPEFRSEGYRLRVTPETIWIEANEPAGVRHALQTLLQLVPAGVKERRGSTAGGLGVPCVDIVDRPRFAWRGLMLDVSRHFFPKETIKALLDQMACYKLNVFHWHLTDDQGWRIEIKSHPELTQVGAWRVPRVGPFQTFHPLEPGEPVTMPPPDPGEAATEGGFYTQDDVREIVAYAADRGITIVPEIDVPGHSLAMIAALPRLSCTGKNYAVNCGSWFRGIDANSLCAGNEEVFAVLESVFAEVAALFPGEYIHVGGDECYKGFWAECPRCQARRQTEGLRGLDELQSYFIRRVEQILQRLKRKLVGWEEIAEGGLAPGATVMSWRGLRGGREAAKLGHGVVMTPYFACYLNLHQSDPMLGPCLIPLGPREHRVALLRVCYDFNPVPPDLDPARVLGAEACLWTEFIAQPRALEAMLWPRLLALAEVFWTEQQAKDWDDFVRRMGIHETRLEQLGIKVSRAAYAPLARIVPVEGERRIAVWTQIAGIDLHYTFDGSEPDQFSARYGGPLAIPRGAVELRVAPLRANRPVGPLVNFSIAGLERRHALQGTPFTLADAISLADERDAERLPAPPPRHE